MTMKVALKEKFDAVMLGGDARSFYGFASLLPSPSPEEKPVYLDIVKGEEINLDTASDTALSVYYACKLMRAGKAGGDSPDRRKFLRQNTALIVEDFMGIATNS